MKVLSKFRLRVDGGREGKDHSFVGGMGEGRGKGGFGILGLLINIKKPCENCSYICMHWSYLVNLIC